MGGILGFSYDATTNSYTVRYRPHFDGPGYSGPLSDRSLTYSQADIVSGQANFTTYSKADTDDATLHDVLELFTKGSGNSLINLTYVSYGIHSVGDGVHFLQSNFFIFGAPTSPVPTSGTGSWSGIVDGLYNASSIGQTYRMSGTSSLTADFSAGTVNASIAFTGQNLVAGWPSLATQTFSGSGGITNQGTSHFTGVMSSPGFVSGAYYNGAFYGDGAEEYGFVFNYFDAARQFNGVAVGR